MCGINKMRDVVHANVLCQPRHAAKAADAGLHRLRLWVLDPTGIGQHGGFAQTGQLYRQSAGFGRAAQDQDVAHV